MSGEKFIPVAQLDDWDEDDGFCVTVEDQQIALFKISDDEVAAIGNICPHQGAPLADGFYDIDDCIVTCPLHAWDFDVRNGQRTNGPESVLSYQDPGGRWQC